MKLGSSRGMDTKPPPGSERNKPRHELRLTRRSQPPYPWPPEQAQPGVSKPCRTTERAGEKIIIFNENEAGDLPSDRDKNVADLITITDPPHSRQSDVPDHRHPRGSGRSTRSANISRAIG